MSQPGDVVSGVVAVRDAYTNALASFGSQGAEVGGVFGEKECAEGEDADVVLGVGEVAMPDIGGDGGAVWVDEA